MMYVSSGWGVGLGLLLWLFHDAILLHNLVLFSVEGDKMFTKRAGLEGEEVEFSRVLTMVHGNQDYSVFELYPSSSIFCVLWCLKNTGRRINFMNSAMLRGRTAYCKVLPRR
jgi:hypothetical protein